SPRPDAVTRSRSARCTRPRSSRRSSGSGWRSKLQSDSVRACGRPSLSSNYPPRDDEMSEAENLQPHMLPQMLRCPKCKRDFAEIKPNGLRFGSLLVKGVFKIVCGALLENGTICRGRRKWRTAKIGYSRDSL